MSHGLARRRGAASLIPRSVLGVRGRRTPRRRHGDGSSCVDANRRCGCRRRPLGRSTGHWYLLRAMAARTDARPRPRFGLRLQPPTIQAHRSSSAWENARKLPRRPPLPRYLPAWLGRWFVALRNFLVRLPIGGKTGPAIGCPRYSRSTVTMPSSREPLFWLVRDDNGKRTFFLQRAAETSSMRGCVAQAMAGHDGEPVRNT